MRALTPTLLAAQQSEPRIPYVKMEARNDPLGVVKLLWERLYTGAESDGPHALTMASDGSLIRIRISSAAESRRLYRQRVTNPGPGSDFSVWTYLNVYNVANAAACSLGKEVSLFWVKTNGEISHIKSTDNGATWSGVDYPGYAPTGAVGGMTAAFRPDGDLFLFFSDANDLYLIKCLNGAWQPGTVWNKTTGNLSGAAVVYDGDWKLLVSGREADGNFRLWSLVYGDGAELTAGVWSSLQAVMTAPSDSSYEFGPVFMDKPDLLRLFCNEKYTAEEAYNRPLSANVIPGSVYLDNLWTEPQPFDFQNSSGLALSHNSDYAWLSCPSGIWRAPLALQSLDLSADVLALKTELLPSSGRIALGLRNEEGQYNFPGNAALAVLERGCRIELHPGYRMAAGAECSEGLSFILKGYKHVSAGGQASIILYAWDGWTSLKDWTSHYPMRWNASSQEVSVKTILACVLARAGLKMEVLSQSDLITAFFPDFTIQAGENGRNAVGKLLSLVPDRLFIEGALAYLLNPLEDDSPVYAYGVSHPILEGSFRQDSATFNRLQTSGWNQVTSQPITADSFDWSELNKGTERLLTIEDPNLQTVDLAHQRGETILRQAAAQAVSGLLRTAVNCGQQLMDVIDITDSRAGLSAVKKRVVGISISYNPSKGEYAQKILISGV
jgi:hypothetical protein